MSKVATQWNSGATRESNPGPQARIPSALTTKPLSRRSCFSTWHAMARDDGDDLWVGG